MKEIKLPNLIIAGAPKSGSSSLFYWLTAHPEVCGSRVKETHFFNDAVLKKFNAGANAHEHDLSKYSEYFSHCDVNSKVILEATPMYLYFDTPIREISKWENPPRFVFILREPSVRAYSQFRFNKYRLGNIPLKKSYTDYLKETAGTKDGPLERGHYIKFLSKYINAFGRENVFVVQSEAIFKNREAEMKKLAEFLGISPDFYETFDYFKRNETKKMRSTKLHRLGLKLQPLFPQTLQENVLIPLYLKFNATGMPPTPKRDLELIQQHKPEFKEDNEALAKTFDQINLDYWK